MNLVFKLLEAIMPIFIRYLQFCSHDLQASLFKHSYSTAFINCQIHSTLSCSTPENYFLSPLSKMAAPVPPFSLLSSNLDRRVKITKVNKVQTFYRTVFGPEKNHRAAIKEVANILASYSDANQSTTDGMIQKFYEVTKADWQK